MLPNLTGQTIGKYQILERLGQGENAVVYRARQLNLGRDVALKVLPVANRAAYERLRLESQLLAKLQHPGIRQVYGIEEMGPLAYAVLEYADYSLKASLAERRQQQKPFTHDETVKLLKPIAEVLDYLHSRRLVHMDVKPENILLTREGRVMLSDFGVTQSFGKPLTRGTPAYVAPEVINDEPVSAATDIYSLGVVAFEMLAGRPPFSGDTPLTLWRHHTQTLPPLLDRTNRACSNSVAWVVNRALAKDPHARYVSATAFISALENADKVSGRLRTLPERRPWVAPTSAVGLMAVAALVLLRAGIWPWPQSGPAFITMTPNPIATATLAPVPAFPSVGTSTPDLAVVEPTATIPQVIRPTETLAPTITVAPTNTPASTATATSPPDQAACINAGWQTGAAIYQPRTNAVLPRGKVVLRGMADLPNSIAYQLRLYRLPNTADNAALIVQEIEGKANGNLGTLDVGNLPPGSYLLRLRVLFPDRNYKECDVPVTLE